MSAAAHGLLSRISEQKRDKEAEVLLQLTEYKQKLGNIIVQSEQEISILQGQHGVMLHQGTHGFALMMMDQSVTEHRQRIVEVRFEMGELDKAIAQQRQKWSEHHKKHVAHDNMHDMAIKKEKRVAEHKEQTLLDSQYSATMVAKKSRGDT